MHSEDQVIADENPSANVGEKSNRCHDFWLASDR